MQVRSVDLINRSLFLAPKKSKKDEDEGTLATRTFSEKEIFNYLNFTSNNLINRDEKRFTVPKENLKDEIRLSSIAKKAGVNTPDIDSNGNYRIKYDKADINKNPLTKGHIKEALNQIRIMDEAGLIHGDIEQGHIFYSKDSDDVEFDCFRFGYLTDEKPHDVAWSFAECEFPTNLNQFENNCIGHYLTQMETKDDKTNFIKEYLPIASEFHKERANYLEKEGKGTPDMIKYEKTKAKMFENPDDTTVSLFKQRVETEYKQRQYFTDWDEGNGACGHTPDEKRAVNAVSAHFDSLHNGIDYYDRLSDLETEAKDPAVKQYLNYEKEYAKHFIDNRIQQVAGGDGEEYSGMAFWTLNPKNENNKTHKNVPENQKTLFNKTLNLLKTSPMYMKSKVTAAAKSLYQEMLILN